MTPYPTVSYPTKLAEAFAAKAIEIYYQNSVAEEITNQDYEGELKDKSSILNVLTFGAISSHDYTGATMTVDDIAESSGQLVTNQAKDFYFRVKSYDKFRSYIKNPEGTIQSQVGKELKKVVDQYILGFYTEVASGQRIGGSYTTGTVSIDTSGNVTGSGTTFTAAMVGRGFKATGHSRWYRVKTYSSATAIVIELDTDDQTSTYNGGVITSAAYQIEATSPLQVTKTNLYDYINQMANMLDNAEVPEDQRWLALPPDIWMVMKEMPEYIPSGSSAALEDVVKNGKVGRCSGFQVYKSTRCTGDNTNGYRVIGGHKSAITYAMGLTENGMEDLIGNFGKAYKSLYVYGAKVVDERRKALTELFCYK